MRRRATAVLIAVALISSALLPVLGGAVVDGSAPEPTETTTGHVAGNGTQTPTLTPTPTVTPQPTPTVTPQPTPSAESTPTPLAAVGEPGPPDELETGADRGHPKVESGLDADRERKAVAQSSEGSTVDVVVLASEGESDRAAELVARHGRVVASYGTRIRATLSRDDLGTVANSSAVRFVERPLPVSTGSVSEGVGVIDADWAYEAGFTGENTTVVVIDQGFDPSSPEIAQNVVETRDFTGDGVAVGSTTHGTATAEIVVETAPNVSLVLVAAETYTEYLAAVDYVNGTNPDAVSMSVGFPGSFAGDGTAELDRKITGSVAAGIPWYISSGNYARKHWDGDWQDPDGDGWLNFTADDELLSIESPRDLRLKWEDFPDSDQDYDLYLFDGNGAVAASTTTQSGTQPSRERIVFSGTGTYYLAVQRVNADGNAHFSLFALGPNGDTIEHRTTSESVSVPATAVGATAIGAVYHGDRSLEPFSSRGPTVDGRPKPAFVAPDGVRSDTYGHAFYGTSAAAPHAAGVAALVAESFGGEITTPALRDRLERTAEGVTGSEPDNETGYGMVNASRAVAPQDPTATVVDLPHVNASTEDAVPVEVRFRRAPLGGTLHVAFLGANGTNTTVTRGVNTSGSATSLVANLTDLPDGNLTARARLVGPYGASNAAGFTAPSSVIHVDTDRPATGTTLDPAVYDDDAAASGGGNVTLRFDEPMDTSVAPTVTVEAIPSAPASVGPRAGGWQNVTVWTGRVSLADADENATGNLTVRDAVDEYGNPPESTVVAAFPVDTANPADPNATVVPATVNATTRDDLTVEVIRDGPAPEPATVTVRATGPNGSIATNRTGPVAGNATLSLDLTGVSEGRVEVSARVTDRVGNPNPSGYTANATTRLDATAPAASNLSASAPDPGRLVASFDVSEPLAAANLTLDGPNATSYDVDVLENRSDGSAFAYRLNATRPAGGNYTVRVVAVRDAAGNAATGPSATVEVPAVLVSAATANRTTVARNTPVELSASGTTGRSVVRRYEWDVDGDGSIDTTGETVTHAYPEPGTYRATVEVTGDGGYTDTAGVNVTVTNRAPTADISVPASAVENSTVVLSATNVTDPEGDATTVGWAVDSATVSLDEPNGTSTNATLGDVDTNSTATVTTTVTDEYGARTTYTATLTLNFTVEAPSAGDVVTNRSTIRSVDVVGFSAPNASDPDGRLVAYEWSFDGDDVADRRGARVGYRFPGEGNYTVTLRVVDDEGTTDTARLNVTVLNSAPLAEAGANLTVTAGERTRLDARNTSDPDGDPLGYEWTQVAGPSVDLADANTTRPAFTAPSVGSTTELRFRLNATDDDAAVGTDTVTVAVDPASSGGDEASGGGGGVQVRDTADGEVEVVSRALEDGTVPAGTAAAVRVGLANFDLSRGFLTLELTADGALLDSRRVEVAADGRRTVTLSATFDTPGTYELAVGGVGVGRLLVTDAATPTPGPAAAAANGTASTDTPGTTPTGTPTPRGTDTTTPPSTTAPGSNRSASPVMESTTGADGPGFGLGAALAVLVVAGLLRRRR